MSHELTVYLSVFNLFLTQWVMAILSKGCKPNSFKSQNFLKLSFTNIRGLHSNFNRHLFFNHRFFLNRFPVCFNVFVLLFLVTLCLIVAVQPCMEWIPIKKKSIYFTFYLFAASYVLLQSSAHSLRKRLSSSSYFCDSLQYMNVSFEFWCFSAYCYGPP